MGRVFLTGAGGAIGVHILAHLMEKTDWEVVATDSFRTEHKGYFDRITKVCEEHPEWRQRITLVVHDLNAPFTDRQLKQIGEIDYVLNLASRSDVQNSIDDPIPFIRNNIELMLNMLDFARRARPKVFLHFSTDEVYGPAPKDSGGHKEWDAIVPSNPYSASKAMQEDLAIAWWRSYDIPLIITNTMNNFSTMQSPSKFPALIQKRLQNDEEIDVHATTTGEFGSRHYIDSKNTADAILFILENVKPQLHSPGEIDRPVRLNIVGDQQINNLELVELIGRLMKKEPKYRIVNFHEKNPGHDLHYGLDGTKLADLGWRSPTDLETSMRAVIEWQKENSEWL